MSDIPQDLKYSKKHEWLRSLDGAWQVGITHYAQEQLGDIVYVDLPQVGAAVEAGSPLCAVESVKAAEEVYSPLTGKVKQANQDLAEKPELVNQDPYGRGWMALVESEGDPPQDLLDAQAYEEYLKEL